MSKDLRNAQRRAVYSYYRSLGYSPAEARARRNRPVAVFEDYKERRAYLPEEQARKVKMPSVPASKRSIKTARQRLEKLGINKTTINRITRKKSDILRITHQMELYFKKVGGKKKDKEGRRAWKALKNALRAEHMTKAGFWDMIAEQYEYIVGVIA